MDYYDFKWEKRFRETEFGTIDIEKEPKHRQKPANLPEKPSGKPKVVPFSDEIKLPNIETRKPRDFSPKIPFAKVFGNPVLNFLLSPSQTASPYEDEYNWANYEEDVSRQIAENNWVGRDLVARKQPLMAPEVELPTKPVVNANFVRPAVPTLEWKARPENRPYISRSPKIGSVEVGVPEYNVPAPIPIELPEFHPWFDEPDPLKVPEYVKDFEFETQPMFDPMAPKARRPDSLRDVGVSIEVSSGEVPKVKIRPMSVRASTKRRNDTKAASRWIKLSQLAISLTYGTYTEIMDFIEIFVWDAYYIDPRTGRLVYAMFKEDQKIVNVLNGIAEGKYSVDIAATLVDYGVSQAQDILIGQASRATTRQVIDTGNWRSPQGPQGFINKMQKDFKNVLSQYETKSANDKQRRLLSLPPLSESPRRLWNAKSGLST